ncbi:AlbA family DNA-binding domain-containing protein [Candidatus Neomicrothrix sp.]|uniref:AlbA family DNA-binding domain-containing protein n=1 Tax=Candidatus Neomicrothrix sp. TaxID=2719034 RepID=UPI001B5E0952|nr:ATP-binding protein [Candidatus Microthrix sp.]MBP7851206.1 ATP-binding protein [Candidatus Microthrix sp.]MBP8957190.1 ATP-binding protein [Candidatus Microthrix sp.]MBP9620752.1 ATP-binding protein [Candidatus Microthrix sp.]
MTVIPFQLRPLLGSDPAKVSAEGLQRLIGEQESSVSDWKEKFDGSPDSRRELARDVASFGNAQGGLLVIGLAEGANSAAFEFVGWNDDNLGDLADWVTSVVRGNVSPPLRFSAHCLVGPGEKPVVLVAIDASDRAPHAVDVGSKLQYPVRDGRSKRYLSEAEVADWYGRRLQRAGQRELDLDRLTEEGAGVAEPEVPTVLMGLAPMRPGLGRVLPGDLERYQEELKPDRVVSLGGPWYWNLDVQHRSIRATYGSRTSPKNIAALRTDGSGWGAFQLEAAQQDRLAAVRIGHVLDATLVLLWTLAENARLRNAQGSALVSFQIVAPLDMTLQGVWPESRQIRGIPNHLYSDPANSWQGPTPTSRTSVELEPATSARWLLSTTHFLVLDVANTFGRTDIPFIKGDGTLESDFAGESALSALLELERSDNLDG